LKDVLPEFQNLLFGKQFASEKHAPFHAIRASQFLAFGYRNREKNMKTLIQIFLDHSKSGENVSEWKGKQARDAIQLYLILAGRSRYSLAG